MEEEKIIEIEREEPENLFFLLSISSALIISLLLVKISVFFSIALSVIVLIVLLFSFYMEKIPMVKLFERSIKGEEK